MARGIMRYRFRSELNREDKQVIREALGMRVGNTIEPSNDTPGFALAPGDLYIYLERIDARPDWWYFSVSAPDKGTDEVSKEELKSRLEGVLRQISTEWFEDPEGGR